MRELLLIVLIYLLSPLFIHAQNENPEQEINTIASTSFENRSATKEEDILTVFNDQIAAFNTQNIERLVHNISENFKFFYITSHQLLLEVEGKEKFRKGMENYFKSVNQVQSEIEAYTIIGNRISFKEVVSYLNSNGKQVDSTALGVYEFKAGKITRSWYFID